MSCRPRHETSCSTNRLANTGSSVENAALVRDDQRAFQRRENAPDTFVPSNCVPSP